MTRAPAAAPDVVVLLIAALLLPLVPVSAEARTITMVLCNGGGLAVPLGGGPAAPDDERTGCHIACLRRGDERMRGRDATPR